jgi:endo-1,4-beta-xylanase
MTVAAAPVDELLANMELVDPFRFNDGNRVASTADWEKRREEIKQLFAEYEYGKLPPEPEQSDVTAGEEVTDDATGTSVITLEAKLRHKDRELVLHFEVVLPKGTDKVPVVIQPGFGQRPRRPGVDANAVRPDPARQIVERGYAYVEFMVPEIADDNRDTMRESGIYKLFGEEIDCGALMAWAWGFHRVIDVLEKVDRIDTEKIVVTGHSRYGKAALVAGAFDDRIAVTAPSHSGCAGAAPFRFIYGNSEQLQNIAGAFPHWFREGFNQFSDKVDKLPVDQHLLRALVAPRAQLSNEGTEDAWSNPQGSQLTYLAAKEVYKYLGAEDIIRIRFRPVGHVPNNGDVLDFADHVFFDKPLAEEFGKLAYPVDEKAYKWSAPTE